MTTGKLNPERAEYESEDKRTVMNLLMVGHRPTRVYEVKPGSLSYVFKNTDIQNTINSLLCGESGKLMVSLEAVWDAEAIWVQNLRHFQIGTRRRA